MSMSHDNILKEKQNTNKTNSLLTFGGSQGNDSHSFKKWKYCKRIKNIHPSLPVQTIPPHNLTVDGGRFLLQ